MKHGVQNVGMCEKGCFYQKLSNEATLVNVNIMARHE